MNNVEIYRSTANAMRLDATSGVVITNSRFHDSSADNIYLDDADDILFNNIQSYNNLSNSSITISNGSNGVSLNNSMIYNSPGDGINIINSASVLIHNTVSTSNTVNGISINNGVDVILSKSMIYANRNW